MDYQYIRFSESKRFGKCLHINFFKRKTCSFDCVYCSDGNTELKTIERVFTGPVNMIFQEVSDFIDKNGEPDYIWYSCKGEPSLYLLFGTLNKKIKETYPKVKLASWTNCSLLNREDIRNDLKYCDFIIADLDGVIDENFQKINRPHPMLKLDEILSSLKQFRSEFKGKIWIHTVFLKDFNDSDESISALKDYLIDIKPNSFFISLGSIGAEGPLPDEFKINLEKQLASLPFKYHYE